MLSSSTLQYVGMGTVLWIPPLACCRHIKMKIFRDLQCCSILYCNPANAGQIFSSHFTGNSFQQISCPLTIVLIGFPTTQTDNMIFPEIFSTNWNLTDCTFVPFKRVAPSWINWENWLPWLCSTLSDIISCTSFFNNAFQHIYNVSIFLQ